MNLSIRTRLTLLLTLVFLSALAMVLLIGVWAVSSGINAEIDRELTAEAAAMQNLLEQEHPGMISPAEQPAEAVKSRFSDKLAGLRNYHPQFVLFAISNSRGRSLYSSGGVKNLQLLLPAGLLNRPGGCRNTLLDGVRFRVCIAQRTWGTLIVGKSNEAFREISGELQKLLVPGLPLILLLVLLGSRLLAGLLMLPVVRAAQAADRISLQQLSARLPGYAGNDEFGILVATLNRMIARLEDGVQRVRQFTQDAAHELRTPLTVQRGELELLYQQRELSDEQRESLRRALDRAISMGSMVDNLLLLARSDTGDYPVHKSRFRLDQLISEIAEDAGVLLEGQPVNIVLDCRPVAFNGDRQLLQRLLLNLLENAIRHTPGGEIALYLHQNGSQITILVRDSGCGIAAEHLPHIFDRFYQAGTSRETAGGSGLGLAICRWIVHAHQGELTLESTPGQGTTAKVVLPGGSEYPN